MKELHREPNRKAQRITLVLAILEILAFMTLFLEPLARQWLSTSDASLEEIQTRAELQIVFSLAVMLIASVVGILWIGYFVHLSYLTLKTGIYPPLGTIVLARTRVRTGMPALVAGYLSIAFAALLVAGLVLSGYGIWLLYSAL